MPPGLRACLPLVALFCVLSASAAEPAQVQWRAWDEAGLAAARSAGKSVYVFVASDLSELSRTSEKEIFGRPETVAWLNENFTCLRVDADAQPEVAAYAQHFINTARQLKGWPVHLWLTPELKPYEGANYLPPTEEWGRPGFLKSARSALDAWKQDPERARALAAEAIAQMSAPPPAASGPIDLEARLKKATEAWIAAADLKHGGFGTAPKHPEPELIRFLLTRGPEAKLAAIAAARAIVNGGLRDQDGGFFRRTIDAEWKEPFRQKLVSDQARIALALYEAAEAAQDERLRAAADGALRFAVSMRSPAGRMAAASDASGPGQPALRGMASPAAEGLLAAALLRSADPALRGEGKKLEAHLAKRADAHSFKDRAAAQVAKGEGLKTPADLLGVALGIRAARRAPMSDRMLATAVRDYFNPATGHFMASLEKLPPGIAVRVPAPAEPFPLEALALLAGEQGKNAQTLRRSLLAQIEYDELPSGAVLLALATGSR